MARSPTRVSLFKCLKQFQDRFLVQWDTGIDIAREGQRLRLLYLVGTCV